MNKRARGATFYIFFTAPQLILKVALRQLATIFISLQDQKVSFVYTGPSCPVRKNCCEDVIDMRMAFLLERLYGPSNKHNSV